MEMSSDEEEEYMPSEEDNDEEEGQQSDSENEGPGVKKVCDPCPMCPCVRSSRKSAPASHLFGWVVAAEAAAARSQEPSQGKGACPQA